jgi:heparan-alpha-glucosaminide N-acetyltransferase
MTQTDRFHSIDILKGILVFLLLFVSALYIPGILPVFSGNGSLNPNFDFSRWIVTGFVFMFGMTIPFTIAKKINNGLSSYEISRSIISKSLIMITIGVMMVNTHRVNSELTGINSYVWSAVMFIAVFLVWVRYHDEEKRFFTVTGLRLLGLALLAFLIFKFRSGTFENDGSLITGWWEIPGLIGWGYLMAAFTYLALRNSISGTALILIIFLLLDIFKNLGLTDFFDPVRPFVGVITDGNVPFIILSGHLTSLILKKFSDSESLKTITGLILFGSLSIISGAILKNTLFKSSENIFPTISLIINGVWVIVFLFIYWLTDINKYGRWFVFFKLAGENYMTAYLFPYIIYNLLFLSGVPLFFFRQSSIHGISIAGSGIIAILMMGLSTTIIKMNIRLKF